MTKRSFFFAVVFMSLWQFVVAGVSIAAEEDLTFSGITNLQVEGAFFDVTVTGYLGDTVVARIKIPDRLIKKGVEVLHEQNGPDLRLWVVHERLFGLKRRFGERCQMNFKVPQALAAEIANSSGEVRVEGITAPQVRLRASSGSILAKQIAANLSAQASSGDLLIVNCHGNKALKTSSGRIEVLVSDGNIDARTSSGSHDYSGVRGDIFAQASSGDLEISDHAGGLRLVSSSGDQVGRNTRLTKYASFQTTSGNLDFDFVNPLEEFRFELQSSSGKINVGATSARGKVVTGQGPISITGTSSSGNQTYR